MFALNHSFSKAHFFESAQPTFVETNKRGYCLVAGAREQGQAACGLNMASPMVGGSSGISFSKPAQRANSGPWMSGVNRTSLDVSPPRNNQTISIYNDGFLKNMQQKMEFEIKLNCLSNVCAGVVDGDISADCPA